MADINDAVFDEVDSANTSSGTQPGWPEGMNPSDVNDAARALQGALKRWYDRVSPTVTSSGSANTQTLDYTIAPGSYVLGDSYAFVVGYSNSGATTINVNSLGTKDVISRGSALIGGELVAGSICCIAYNGTAFELLNPGGHIVGDLHVTGDAVIDGDLSANSITTAGDATIGGDIGGNSITTAGGAAIGGDITGNTLVAAGNITSTGGTVSTVNLTASGSTTLAGVNATTITTSGDETVGGNLDVEGTLNVDGLLTANGGLDVTGTVTINGEPLSILTDGSGFALGGNCLLYLYSATKLALMPLNGNTLMIDTTAEIVPAIFPLLSGSCYLSNSGLAASTFYYVYAYMDGVMKLEAAVTPYVIGPNGIAVKSGDGTRTLVGACYTSGAGTFIFDDLHIYVLSWYNRRTFKGINVFTTDRYTSSTTEVEINSEIRINFITWSTAYTDSGVFFSVNGMMTADGTSYGIHTGVGFDSANIEAGASGANISDAGFWQNAALTGYKTDLSEGLHYATVVGAVSDGVETGHWISWAEDNVGPNNDAGTVLTILVKG